MLSKWSQSSLSRDFSLLTLVIGFFAIMIAAWISYGSYENLNEKIVNELENEALRIDRTLIIELDNASYVLESLGREITHYGADDLEVIGQLLSSFNLHSGIDHYFSWIDNDQKVVISSNRGLLDKPIDVSDRGYLKKSLAEPWKVQTGRPIFGRVSGKWILPLSMGLTDYTGRYIGTLLVSVHIASLGKKIRDIINNDAVDFRLYSHTLIPLTASSPESDALFEQPLQKLEGIDFTKAQRGVLQRGNPLFSKSRYAFFEVSERYPYVILLEYDQLRHLEAMKTAILPKLLQLAITACFLIFLLWVIRQRFLTPIIALVDYSRAIAKGELHVPMPQRGPEEVQVLAEQIDKIREYLQERLRVQQELHKKVNQFQKHKESIDFAARLRTESLASLSYEILPSLNSIRGYSEAMRDGLFGRIENKKYRQYIENIFNSTVHLNEIAKDIIALAADRKEHYELEESSVDIAAILRKCLRLLKEHIHNAGIHIKVEASENLPRLPVDPSACQQILLNLLANTINHTPEEGSILVSAALERKGQDKSCMVIRMATRSADITGAQRNRMRLALGSAHTTQSASRRDSLRLRLAHEFAELHQASLRIETGSSGMNTYLSFPQERIIHWH